MSIVIQPARSDDDIADVTRLAWEFIDFLKERYPERLALIESYLIDQQFEEMLANFRTYFVPPAGECMLAWMDGMAVGIVMLKPVQEGLCEMNRMYVNADARGRGVGRDLCNRLINEAKALGYQEMRLNALDRHFEALPLYQSLGFETDPEPPEFAKLDPGIISLRMAL